MKVLWINMTVPPEADAQLGGIKELKNTGGWVLGLAHYLIQVPGIELAIAAASPLVREMTVVAGEKIKYYVVPASSGRAADDELQRENWCKVYDIFRPDVVHIHGTEYRHALTWIQANGAERTVVSVQGLVSVCADYYHSGMSQWEVLTHITPRDLIKGGIWGEQYEFRSIGRTEVELLRTVHHVIGRTRWDRTHLWAINPQAQYHFCNEVLRTEFYQGETWSYGNCRPYTIFLSQAAVAYKGLHQLLKAMPLILRQYPQTQIRIAGFDIIEPSLKRRVMRTGYGWYISRLVRKYGVTGHIHFTGRLNADEMKQELLRANVFCSPSSIENSSNSVGEAQILGVPCVASRVGGMPDIIPSEACGLMYRFDEPVELARCICDLFAQSPDLETSEMQAEARRRHDPETNIKSLLDIYYSLIN